MADERELLREHAQRLLATHKEIAGKLPELKRLAKAPELKTTLEGVRDRVGGEESVGGDEQLGLEAIISRTGRPVLEVANDDYIVAGAESTVWDVRLSNADVRAALKRVIPSVGRVEVDRHPDLAWVGTGWLIADDILVTNRHVASEFAALSLTADGRSFVFKRGWPDRTTRMAARVDFRREKLATPSRAFAVKDVLHIEDDDGPDFAFLKVEGGAGGLSPFLRPATTPPTAEQFVATVGYPAADSRNPDQPLMSTLFGDVYNVKRLAPGQVLRLSDGLVMHDCTTLGGNSGSPIVDLVSGQVIGLHFSGAFLRENRGVPIGEVLSRLSKVRNPSRPTPPPPPADEGRKAVTPPVVPPSAVTTAAAPGSASFTIPLHITVSLGDPAPAGTTLIAPDTTATKR